MLREALELIEEVLVVVLDGGFVLGVDGFPVLLFNIGDFFRLDILFGFVFDAADIILGGSEVLHVVVLALVEVGFLDPDFLLLFPSE